MQAVEKRLQPTEQRAARRFMAWLYRVTANPTLHERFEAVSGEGKVKTLRVEQIIPREHI